jgi:hypothetical protein
MCVDTSEKWWTVDGTDPDSVAGVDDGKKSDPANISGKYQTRR